MAQAAYSLNKTVIMYALLIILVIQINLNNAIDDHIVRDRFNIQELQLDLSNVNISETCETNKTCIFKCCPDGQIFRRFKSCVPSKIHISNVTVYDKRIIKTNRSLDTVLKLLPGFIKNDAKFSRNALWWHKNAYLTEDGKLHLKLPNVYNRWRIIEANHFCVEMKMNFTEIKPVFMVEYAMEKFRQPSSFKKWALTVSTVCLIMTLVVYAMLPQLRDLNGILLMIHLVCLTVATISHACLESYNNIDLRMSQILTISFFYYFFKVASLCWINVIFYRLLKSSISKEVPSSNLMELTKYSAYAIGLPVFMTTAVATIEVSNMADMPSFVTPQIQARGNFSFQEMESLFYLYYPILLLISFNWIVCFIKVVEFCKTSRQFSVVSAEPVADENSFNRPMQFVKLLSALTVFVLLELLSVMHSKGTFDTSALYNLCIGPIIMIIFLWNTNVRRLFVQRVKGYRTDASTNAYGLATIFQKK